LTYTTYAENPHVKGVPEFRRESGAAVMDGDQTRWETKAGGEYRLVAAPGKALIGAWCYKEGYRKGAGFDAIPIFKQKNFIFQMFQQAPMPEMHNVVREIDIPVGAERVTCDLQADPGETIRVSVSDPDGKPAAGKLHVRGRQSENFGGPFLEPVVGAEFDAKGFAPEELRTIYVLDDAHKLGAAVHAKFGDLKDRRLAVRLRPMAEVKGRVLTQTGDALAGLQLEVRERGGTGRTVRMIETGPDGRFSTTLPCGAEFYFAPFGGPYVANFFPDKGKLNPEPGSVTDLGDVKLKPQEMMRRK
jgi:hypothetical protein